MARLEASSILDAVNGIVTAAYPNDVAYINYLPEGFVRPSCLYQQIRVTRADATRWTQLITLNILITIFAAQDAHGHMDTAALLAKQFGVMDALSNGAIYVGDRAVRISAVTGAQDLDAATVELTISYFDDRPDAGSGSADLMEDIKITYYVNNEVI